MSKLVYIGIGLVGYAFAVTVNIEACEGSCLDCVLGNIPDLIQNSVGTYECTVLIPEIVPVSFLTYIFRMEFNIAILEFTIPEWSDDVN